MRVKLLVQTQEFQSWPATKERAGSTSHNLVCVDMSQPADARMTESISYRLKDEEIPKYWDKAMDKVIEVNLRRIATANPARRPSSAKSLNQLLPNRSLYVSQPSRRQIFDGQNPSARAVR